LDTFVADGLIEALAKILDEFGLNNLKKIEDKAADERTPDERLIREIQVNVLCIMI
jgi:hypothetical protein